MNRVLTIILGVALAGLFLLMLPYLLLAGITVIILFRLVFRMRGKRWFIQRTAARGRNPENTPGKRYQQAYARHWQSMNNFEREIFLNRYAPAE